MASADDTVTRRRVKGLAWHFIALFFLALIGAATEVWISGRFDRTLLAVLGWSPILALHTAYAMGLFGALRPGTDVHGAPNDGAAKEQKR